MARRKYSGAQVGAAAKRFAAAGRPGPVFGVRLSRRILPAQRGFVRTGGYYGRYGTRALGSDAEMKFFDTSISFTIDSTGEVPATGQLNLIPQGVTESTRVGRKCVIKSIQIRGGVIYAPGAGALAYSINRLYLVLDKQANGAAAAIGDVFTGNNLVVALRNMANNERFKVLKEWTFVWNSGAGVTTAYNAMQKNLEFYKKCNVPLEFSSTTGAITELKSNNLFLCAGSDGSDDIVTVTAQSRVRFTD